MLTRRSLPWDMCIQSDILWGHLVAVNLDPTIMFILPRVKLDELSWRCICDVTRGRKAEFFKSGWNLLRLSMQLVLADRNADSQWPFGKVLLGELPRIGACKRISISGPIALSAHVFQIFHLCYPSDQTIDCLEHAAWFLVANAEPKLSLQCSVAHAASSILPKSGIHFSKRYICDIKNRSFWNIYAQLIWCMDCLVTFRQLSIPFM